MKSKSSLSRYMICALVGLLVLVGLDQWSKQLAVQHLANQDDIILIPNVLQLHYLENRGAAFGILQNKQWIFVILAVVFFLVACLIFWKMPRTKRYLPLHIIAVCVTAGAIGNVIDRIRLKYVIDFIYISLIDFPVFNLADIYVTMSAVFIFIVVLFVYKDEDFEKLKQSIYQK